MQANRVITENLFSVSHVRVDMCVYQTKVTHKPMKTYPRTLGWIHIALGI